MYDEFTHGDTLGLFLTGAASDGAAQPDPDMSLGGYRGSNYVEQIGFFLTGQIPGIIIKRVSGANGEGIGCLETVDGDSLRWTAPNGTPGPIVAIANGQTKLLETGVEANAANRCKFAIATRSTAATLKGIATVTLVPVYNNVIGSSNVSGAEQAAGEIKLRCMAFRACNVTQAVKNLKIWLAALGTQQTSDSGQLPASGDGTIETSGSFADWPATGFCRISTVGGSLREIVYYLQKTATILTVPAAGRGLLGTSALAGAASDKLDAVPGIKIASESPTGGAFTVAANENDTAGISGFSWSTGITESTGLNIGDIAAGGMIGLWLWLIIIAGQTATPSLQNAIKWSFDAQ
jgi:hypothetical protein